jgi:hypothetical protein
VSGPYTYQDFYYNNYLSNSCYCSYNGDPLSTFPTFFSGPSQWAVSAPLTDGNRVLVSTENFTSGTAYAVEDHGESRNAQRVDLWNWDTNPQLNVEVYIGVPPNGPPPAYYYIRNAYSGLYVTDSYLATAEADWAPWLSGPTATADNQAWG